MALIEKSIKKLLLQELQNCIISRDLITSIHLDDDGTHEVSGAKENIELDVDKFKKSIIVNSDKIIKIIEGIYGKDINSFVINDLCFKDNFLTRNEFVDKTYNCLFKEFLVKVKKGEEDLPIYFNYFWIILSIFLAILILVFVYYHFYSGPQFKKQALEKQSISPEKYVIKK